MSVCPESRRGIEGAVERERYRPLRAGQRLRVVVIGAEGLGSAVVVVADRAAIRADLLSRLALSIADPTQHEPPELEASWPSVSDTAGFRSATVPPPPAWGVPGIRPPAEWSEVRVGVGDQSSLSEQRLAEIVRTAASAGFGAEHCGDVARQGEGWQTGVPEAGTTHGGPGPELIVGLTDRLAEEAYAPFLQPPAAATVWVDRAPSGEAVLTASSQARLVHPAVLAELVHTVARHLAADSVPTTPSARELGRGAASCPVPRTRLEAMFAERVRAQPDVTAVVCGDQSLSYAQLDIASSYMAQRLLSAGAGSGKTVGVVVGPQIGLVVALIAVLKSGAAYVPIDPQYPPARVTQTLLDGRCAVVVATEALAPDDAGALRGIEVLCIDHLGALQGPAEPARLAAPSTDVGGASPACDDPAYVIFTSGSTGRPKGVVVRHDNVLALISATADSMRLGPDDVWTMFHSSAFDFSVWELWGCLLTGGRLVIVDEWTRRSPADFHRLLARRGVTVLSQTPSAFYQLIEEDTTAEAELDVRLVVLGGEPLDARAVRPWLDRHPLSHCAVVNMFGITETTVHVTARSLSADDITTGTRNVGRALPGWSVTIRDPAGGVLPPGGTGEIVVGGRGVSAGYIGRPDLTAERFVTDETTEERLYRSGDLGRMWPDGSIEHLGRIDSQVKIRGYRVELDEVRSAVAELPSVRDVAVLAVAADGDCHRVESLTAYVCPHPGATLREVADAVAATLPAYMRPSVVQVDAIPLTVNGKVDAAHLREIRQGGPAVPRVGEGPVESTSEEPDDVAATVRDLWEQLLGAAPSDSTNFFESGGNSLLVVRLLRGLRDSGMPTPTYREFYENAAFSALVELLRRRREAS
ncbi:MAG: amino acid adenylation domain-containing protein [Marmoricola sp.]